jgi:hypothetical protein
VLRGSAAYLLCESTDPASRPTPDCRTIQCVKGHDAPSERTVGQLECAIFVALFLGGAWSIVSQFYNPSAGYSLPTFSVLSIGKVIELGVFTIAVILTVGYGATITNLNHLSPTSHTSAVWT